MSITSFLAQWMDLGGRSTMAGKNRSSPLLATSRRIRKPVRSSARRKIGGKVKLRPKVRNGRKGAAEEGEMIGEPPLTSPLVNPVVSVIVGPDRRLFVAHEDVLARATFFGAVLEDQFTESGLNKVVALPDEDPEVFSCLLELLYKGDYYPRLLYVDDGASSTSAPVWYLEEEDDQEKNGMQQATTAPSGVSRSNNHQVHPTRNISPTAALHHHRAGLILRDTAIYCAAVHYGLPDALAHLALRKQGLRTGIAVDVILRSAQFAYEHTLDSEDRLRARYLAMIIRSRAVFRESGTMQAEMERGHPFFFDLFVALCNRVDDLEKKVREAEGDGIAE
ncbi:uncharacterized protein BO97DRAFT_267502 [Aspergillus homomorphus CBS 101889]|uniref:Uncharacterized protein n=1 Tax=Aspergillus homomorphus (strain CBS 101889) TaxID=1450537 RepID=A0A395HHL2_ASPHC|nr:hypothetical protein BO97DRAFT_267502 [Aspergillus homomorphus CBS 101889]RAL07116.1 hypothetical protein BO97DRAFT_267502 [Aspergillus homomorphus CBS 101889]